MTNLDADQISAVVDATWPPAAVNRRDGWVFRDGKGGGKRVSACTAEVAGDTPDIEAAEAESSRLGQDCLFMIREGEEELDTALARRGYAMIDPVDLYLAPVSALTEMPAPRLSGFSVYPPLAVMKEMWEEAGIGRARQDVMARATVQKTSILGRIGDHAGGAGFVALHNDIAMVHALVVASRHQRQGLGHNMMKVAAKWAQDRGAGSVAALVTQDNHAAQALYRQIGMRVATRYHYRLRP